MKKRGVLSHPERVFLTTCLKGYKAGLDVKWGHFDNEKLGRGQIDQISKKFRKQGFIEKKGYNINEKKIDDLKKLLEENEKQDKKFHSAWKILLTTFVVILILLLIGLLSKRVP